MIYPAGTPLGDIKHYDRSKKVAFKCKDHPDSMWRSKEPSVSTWFGAPGVSRCEHSHLTPGQFVTVAEYDDGWPPGKP